MLNSKFLGKLLAIVAIATVSGNLIYTHVIKDKYTIALNDTTSLPDYFYIINKKIDKNSIKNKDIIAFKFKKLKDSYYEYNHNFIKQIKCMPDDVLSVKQNNKSATFLCNEEIIGTSQPTDSNGNKVKNFYFNKKIPKDKYFVMGTAWNSYDSRYWGFVDKKDILGVSIW